MSSFGTTSPIDLTTAGMPGCSLLVLTDFVDLVPAAGSTATWSFQLPNTPSLIGASSRQQAFVFDAAANAFGLAASNAIEVTLEVR